MSATEKERIAIETGDITVVQADAIVNAANSSLMGGGGVDGAIHRAGGGEILKECKEIRNSKYPEGLPTGKAVITGAGKLPASYVIHTVGPVWHGGDNGEEQELADAYKNSLALGAEKKLHHLVFPAISTGVYGFPKEKAAGIAYKTVSEFLQSHEYPEKVTFLFFSEDDRRVFRENI